MGKINKHFKHGLNCLKKDTNQPDKLVTQLSNV